MRQQGDEVICLIALWLGMIVLDVRVLSPTRNARRDAQEASEEQHSARVLHRQGWGSGFGSRCRTDSSLNDGVEKRRVCVHVQGCV